LADGSTVTQLAPELPETCHLEDGCRPIAGFRFAQKRTFRRCQDVRLPEKELMQK